MARHVDFVVWQKPYRYVAHGLDVPVGSEVAQCGSALAAHFGTPVYEDAWLAVYPARNPDPGQRDGNR